MAKHRPKQGAGKGHVSKSKSERSEYSRSIQQQPSIGTSEAPSYFEHTDSPTRYQSSTTEVTTEYASGSPTAKAEELGATTTLGEPKPKVVRERGPEIFQAVWAHFAKNWVAYTIAVILGAAGWAWSMQMNLTKLDLKTDNIRESVQKLDKRMDETVKRLGNDEKASSKNEWGIASLQKVVDRIRTELDNMRKSLQEKEDKSKPSKNSKKR